MFRIQLRGAVRVRLQERAAGKARATSHSQMNSWPLESSFLSLPGGHPLWGHHILADLYLARG
jgi:hypothetical protein